MGLNMQGHFLRLQRPRILKIHTQRSAPKLATTAQACWCSRIQRQRGPMDDYRHTRHKMRTSPQQKFHRKCQDLDHGRMGTQGRCKLGVEFAEGTLQATRSSDARVGSNRRNRGCLAAKKLRTAHAHMHMIWQPKGSAHKVPQN